MLSPGVPLTHPKPHAIVDQARYVGAEVIGDMEVFAREIGADPAVPGRSPVIAVTGTNGKSTTTALIGHILAESGFDVQVGGNIGKAVLELEPPTAKTIYVLELSSYQIDLSPGLVPDVVGPVEHHARSHRPPRLVGELRRLEGAPAETDLQGRPDRYRRR